MSLRPGKVLRSFLLALCLLSLTDCSGDVGIVVAVENWPSSSPYLLIDTLVNGTPGQQFRIPAGQLRFVVRLPAGQTGELALRANAIDETGCKVAQGQLTAALERGLRRTSEGTLSLNPVQPALCPITINLPAGSGRVESSPPGLTCSNDIGCRGEFPRLTAIKLTPIPTSYRYYADWSQGCSGNRDCNLVLDRGTTTSIQFKPYTCSSDGWCIRPVQDNGTPVSVSLRTLQIDTVGGAWIAGDQGTLIYCDSSSCELKSKFSPTTSNRMFLVNSTIDANIFSAIQIYDAGNIYQCSTDGCRNIINLYGSGAACGSVYFKKGTKIISDSGYLWFSDGASIFRLPQGNPGLANCEVAFSFSGSPAPSVQDFYIKSQYLWMVRSDGKAFYADCSGLPCSTLTEPISSQVAISKVHGIDSEVWFSDTDKLHRCDNLTHQCTAQRPLPGFGGDLNLGVYKNTVWAVSGNYIGLFDSYTAVTAKTIPRILSGFPASNPSDNYDQIRQQWFWGNERSLFLLGSNAHDIEICNGASCAKTNLSSLSFTTINAISGNGNNTWAIGDNGTILHYQGPAN